MAWNYKLEMKRRSDNHVYYTWYAGTAAQMTAAEKREVLESLEGWDAVKLTVETVPALFEQGSYVVSTDVGEQEITVTIVYESPNVINRVNSLRKRLLDRRKISLTLTRAAGQAGNATERVEVYDNCIVSSIGELEILSLGTATTRQVARLSFTVLCMSGMRAGEGDE